MAKVQILIPCYNYARYLTACVDSVTSQPGVDLDILIIDDCSTDNTPEVCRELMARDSRIRVIRHEKNMRHIATYNEGIADIRGDYFVLLSADDMLTPGCLSRAVTVMEAHPNVGLVYGTAISFDGEPPQPRTSVRGVKTWSGSDWIEMVCRSGRNFLACPEAVVRASIQQRIGGYDPKLPHSGDMEMWMRIASISDVAYVRGSDQAFYRVHAASMQRTVHAGLLFDLIARDDAIRSAFAKEGSALPNRVKLYKRARKALAFTAIQHARKLYHFPDANDATAAEYVALADKMYPEGALSARYSLWLEEGGSRNGVREIASHLTAKIQKLYENVFFHRAEYHWSRHTGTQFPRSFFI